MAKTLGDKIRGLCKGHPHAKVSWPHRELHELAKEADELSVQRQRIEALEAENTRLRGLLWYGWSEMNAIRAESGVPRDYDGRRKAISEDHWSNIVDAMADALGEDATPWPSEAACQALATTTQASAPAKKLDPELERLLAWSRRNPPTDAELREQRVSWVRGELRMSHPDMSYEEADERARRAATTHEPVVSEDQVEAAPFYCPHCGEGIDIEEVSKAWDDGDRIWPAQVSIVKATQEGE